MTTCICANPACGKPFEFRKRDYTTQQIYCRKECRLAAQAVRQRTRIKARRDAEPPAPRKPRTRKVSADRPQDERRAVLAAAVVEARRMVNEEACPDCGALLDHDEALVFCRLRAVGRCDWMRLLTQRDRDPARDAQPPNETTESEPTNEPEETEPMPTIDTKPTKRRATTRDPSEVRRLILTALASGPLTATVVSNECGLAKSVVYRYLKMLCAEGRVVRHSGGVYQLAPVDCVETPPKTTVAPAATESPPATPARVVEGFGLERLTVEARQAFVRIASRGLRALLDRVEGT